MQPVKMYTTASCPFCVHAKRLLANRGALHVQEIRVDLDPLERGKMMEITGRRSVPQIFIGEHYVGGCDELVALDHDGQLLPMLQGIS